VPLRHRHRLRELGADPIAAEVELYEGAVVPQSLCLCALAAGSIARAVELHEGVVAPKRFCERPCALGTNFIPG